MASRVVGWPVSRFGEAALQAMESLLLSLKWPLVNGSMAQGISVQERLTLDGEVLRGSGRTDGKPLQLLSA